MSVRSGESKDEYIERLGQEWMEKDTGPLTFILCKHCEESARTSVFVGGKYDHTICVGCKRRDYA